MSKKQEESRKNGAVLSKQQLESIRSALQEKRADILRQRENQLSELYSPDKHHLADLEEMASDTTDTDSLCAFVDLSSSTVEQIDTALVKLDEGTYGCCEACEKPIHPERLDVLPFASLCVQCQRKKEMNKSFEEQVPEVEG